MNKLILLILSAISFTANSQSEFDLNKLFNTQNRDIIVFETDSFLNKKSEYGSKMEILNSSQKIVVYVENLEREINNGGFHQFYLNSSGDYAHETVDALTAIGASKAAEIVRKANSEFPHGIVPKDRSKRFELLKSIENKSQNQWDKLSSKIYRVNEKTGELEIENLLELLYNFIKNNKTEIEK